MFRVNRIDGRSRTVVSIDGRLIGDYVHVAEACCHQAISAGKPLHIVLNDVTEVDERGRALLIHLARAGCELHGRGVYTSYIVEALKSAAAADANAAARHNGTAPALVAQKGRSRQRDGAR